MQGTLPQQNNAQPANPSPATPDSTRTQTGDAVLTVTLPEDAKIYVNGRLTKTPGKERSYVSRNLQKGQQYSYEVRADLDINGKRVSHTKVVEMSAGVKKSIEFDFDQSATVVTSVTLHVPDDAQVSLGGLDTKASGSLRLFSTTKLSAGKSWDKYPIEVSVERDGKTVTQKRLIDIAAGESLDVRFKFEEAVIASVASR